MNEPVIIETAMIISTDKIRDRAHRKESAMIAALEECREQRITDEQVIRERVLAAARSVE